MAQVDASPPSHTNMHTYAHLVIPSTEEGLAKAVDILKLGGLVAFPTETVYGLGANARDAAAVRSIFITKGRPASDPLIVHVKDTESALGLIQLNSECASLFSSLTRNFWPGPLTIICKALPIIPPEVTAGTGMVGVRCPKHPLALRLLTTANIPIAAPSANRFGHVSPTRAFHVLDDLGAQGVHVLDGDVPDTYIEHTCEHGIESTVIKLPESGTELEILRQGAVTKVALDSFLKQDCDNHSVHYTTRIVVRHRQMHAREDDASTPSDGEIAPGQAVTHYAPSLPTMMVSQIITNHEDPEHITGEVVHIDASQLSRCMVIDFAGQLSALRPLVLGYRDLSEGGNTRQAARELFDALRSTEIPQAQSVLLARIPAEVDDFAPGVLHRMFRAASGRCVCVCVQTSSNDF